VLDGGVDLLEAVVASAQGEQDPRCLLLVFRALRSLVRLLANGPPPHAARLEEVLSHGQQQMQSSVLVKCMHSIAARMG